MLIISKKTMYLKLELIFQEEKEMSFISKKELKNYK